MQLIPLQAVPSQSLSVQLNGQACSIAVYQKSTGLYIDLGVNGTALMFGVICENNNRLVRYAYLGFVGDLVFTDSQGSADPDYTGLGSRFNLIYLEPADLAAFGLAA